MYIFQKIELWKKMKCAQTLVLYSSPKPYPNPNLYPNKVLSQHSAFTVEIKSYQVASVAFLTQRSIIIVDNQQ